MVQAACSAGCKLDITMVYILRAYYVQITLIWQEVDAAEKPKPVETIEDEKQTKIAELEKQLAELKSAT